MFNNPSKHLLQSTAVALLSATLSTAALAADPAEGEDFSHLEPEAAAGELRALENPRAKAARTTDPVVADEMVVFGYHPSYRDGLEYHYHWHSLTHIGYSFLEFNAAGGFTSGSQSAFTNRPSAFKSGGSADLNGVEVHIALANTSFDESILDTVMQSPSLRATLINNLINYIQTDGFIQGVNLDFEFDWGTTTRDGITAFVSELRTAMDAWTAVSPGTRPRLGLSIYVNPIYSGTRHDVAGLAPNIDFMLLSCYPWAGGFSSSAGAVANKNSFVNQGNNYIDAGLPPEKLVLALASYGHDWDTVGTTYGTSVVGSSDHSIGYFDGKYSVTLEPDFGGPYTRNYQLGAEAPWYTYNDGDNRVAVFDDEISLTYKIALATSWEGDHAGRRLGGIGFWELGWMAEEASYDPIGAAVGTRTRTYPNIYQTVTEILSTPGTTEYLFEGFEGDMPDFRWRDPDESPDTANTNTTNTNRALAAAPGGVNAPTDTSVAMQVNFQFTAASNNRLFFRHEVLGHPDDTTVIDTNTAEAYFDPATTIIANVHASAGAAGRQVRMAVMDANRQLEFSTPFTLASGWQRLEWDLSDASQLAASGAVTTAEPAFVNGNGVLNTDADVYRDLGFVGFRLEGGAAGSGTVYFDELSYRASFPGGAYKINEFAYANVDGEYVEIYGPSGVVPAGVELVFYDSADGSVEKTVSLAGLNVPGSGLLAVGDPAVTGVASSTGFSNAVDDIPNLNPSAMQIRRSTDGAVYDSVVYEAFGGLDELLRAGTGPVTQEGWPWIGEVGPGTYALGRYPNGADTDVNAVDFSAMPRSVGTSNGNTIALGNFTLFEGATSHVVRTYEWASAGVIASGSIPTAIGNSPGGGGAYRVADSSGGVHAFLGDKSIGSSGGHKVSGHWYLHPTTDQAAVTAVGFCGTQGSTFFSASPASSGYEDGYWLLYYVNDTATISNGLGANNGGDFFFVHATNDNQDGQVVEVLGTLPRTSTSAAADAWCAFELAIDPNANVLLATVNGTPIYNGVIPAGGPTSGTVQFGHRESAAGGTDATGGTWVDTILLQTFSSGFTHPTDSFELE